MADFRSLSSRWACARFCLSRRGNGGFGLGSGTLLGDGQFGVKGYVPSAHASVLHLFTDIRFRSPSLHRHTLQGNHRLHNIAVQVLHPGGGRPPHKARGSWYPLFPNLHVAHHPSPYHLVHLNLEEAPCGALDSNSEEPGSKVSKHPPQPP